MKAFKIPISNICSDHFFRADFKYHSFIVDANWNIFNAPEDMTIRLADVLREDYIQFSYEDDEYKGIPTGQSYIDEDGDVIGFQPVTKEDHPGRLKYAVSSEHILLSSLRLAKVPALNLSLANMGEYVFSNGFYSFKVQNGWDRRFVLYLLRNKRIKQLLDESIYRGIGISAFRSEDLLKIKIRNVAIDVQQTAVTKITSIERVIKKKKTEILSHQEIIDKVFTAAFDIDSKILYDIAAEKSVLSKSSDLVFNNSNIRFSFRWDKTVAIQEKMIEMCTHCKRLDRYIISTKNGWSPECSEAATLYRVLGIDAIQKSAILALENVKFTDQTGKNVELYTVKNGDFFVSRGNTTDLVAMASVADIPEEDEEPIVFPDLMIRVEFNGQVNKLYMAYAFNSFIGRLYFKYASKGKNQTMVKISQKELKDFYVPIPLLDEQQRIVEKIQAEIDQQNAVKAEIIKLRSEIDSIIEEAIRG